MISSKDFVVLVYILAVGRYADAVQAKNNSVALYFGFIFGLHIPVLILFVILVFVCRSDRSRSTPTVTQSNLATISNTYPTTYAQNNPTKATKVVQVQPLNNGASTSTKLTQPTCPKTPFWRGDRFILPQYWIQSNYVDVNFIDITDKADFIKILVYKLWKVHEVGIGRNTRRLYPYVYINIHTVKRVQNAALFQKYEEKRRMMKRKKKYIDFFKGLENIDGSGPVLTTDTINKDSNLRESDLECNIDHGLNEHYLFHGTRENNIEGICRRGLSTFYASKGSFGKGIYAAEDPTKSDQYTEKSTTGNNTLLLCRVCLGEIFIQKTTANANILESPPCSKCYKHGCDNPDHKHTFDAVVSTSQVFRFREFIVYRDYRMYPEYIIKYKRCEHDLEMRKCMERYEKINVI